MQREAIAIVRAQFTLPNGILVIRQQPRSQTGKPRMANARSLKSRGCFSDIDHSATASGI
jgi:hypothetical protein